MSLANKFHTGLMNVHNDIILQVCNQVDSIVLQQLEYGQNTPEKINIERTDDSITITNILERLNNIERNNESNNIENILERLSIIECNIECNNESTIKRLQIIESTIKRLKNIESNIEKLQMTGSIENNVGCSSGYSHYISYKLEDNPLKTDHLLKD